jgi:DNA-binding NarL/FixJ family response regulator
MLSTYPEKQYAVRCIKLGAAGYLNKSADPDDMVAAVRKVAGGGHVCDATPPPRRWPVPWGAPVSGRAAVRSA